MTRKRIDEHSTEFGLWLREQKEIDSTRGFVATNLDYIWANYKTGDWMLIEEKRFKGSVTYSQSQLLSKIDTLSQNDKKYHGLHILKFENTNPEDGGIRLDGNIITKTELLDFLQFKVNYE